MTPDEIITRLARLNEKIPVEALQAAEHHRAELTPRLLASLAEIVAQPALIEDDPDIQLPFYAMYLLAAWRVADAQPLLLGFLRLPGEQALDLSGDIVTQDMGLMLAQTWGEDPAPIVKLAEDQTVNEWARGAAIKALAQLTAWGEMPRAVLLSFYRRIIAATVAAEAGTRGDDVLGNIVCYALDMQLVELRDELLALYDDGHIQTEMVIRAEVVDELGHRPALTLPQPITNVADAIAWWGCFERETTWTPPSAPWPEPPARLATAPVQSFEPDGAPKPYRAPPKVGRNDPCPCGSGKKYKKCCGA